MLSDKIINWKKNWRNCWNIVIKCHLFFQWLRKTSDKILDVISVCIRKHITWILCLTLLDVINFHLSLQLLGWLLLDSILCGWMQGCHSLLSRMLEENRRASTCLREIETSSFHEFRLIFICAYKYLIVWIITRVLYIGLLPFIVLHFQLFDFYTIVVFECWKKSNCVISLF